LYILLFTLPKFTFWLTVCTLLPSFINKSSTSSNQWCWAQQVFQIIISVSWWQWTQTPLLRVCQWPLSNTPKVHSTSFLTSSFKLEFVHVQLAKQLFWES
jgi:hypothetical protein